MILVQFTLKPLGDRRIRFEVHEQHAEFTTILRKNRMWESEDGVTFDSQMHVELKDTDLFFIGSDDTEPNFSEESYATTAARDRVLDDIAKALSLYVESVVRKQYPTSYVGRTGYCYTIRSCKNYEWKDHQMAIDAGEEA